MSIWSLTFWCCVNLVPTVKYWTKFDNVSNELNKLLFPCHLGEYLEYNVISHTHVCVCGRRRGGGGELVLTPETQRERERERERERDISLCVCVCVCPIY